MNKPQNRLLDQSAELTAARNAALSEGIARGKAERKIATLISSADALLAYAGYHGEISRNSAEGRALIDGLLLAVKGEDPGAEGEHG